MAGARGGAGLSTRERRGKGQAGGPRPLGKTPATAWQRRSLGKQAGLPYPVGLLPLEGGGATTTVLGTTPCPQEGIVRGQQPTCASVLKERGNCFKENCGESSLHFISSVLCNKPAEEELHVPRENPGAAQKPSRGVCGQPASPRKGNHKAE